MLWTLKQVFGTGDHPVKWNKLDPERQVSCFLSYIESLKKKEVKRGTNGNREEPNWGTVGVGDVEVSMIKLLYILCVH
jgi:hypothetical protein